jgi:hypothetical protein
MGLGPVLNRNDIELKRQFRWMLEVGQGGNDSGGIGGIVGNAVNVLPPLASERPSLSFKEIEIEHTSETIFMPTKAQWKPLKVKVYDVATNLKNNMVFDWVVRFYNAQKASYNFVSAQFAQNFKKTVNLSLYSGQGCCLESWQLDGAWPREINFGELNMESSAIVTIDMELRFDRAYVTTFNENGQYVSAGKGCLDYRTGANCQNGFTQ